MLKKSILKVTVVRGNNITKKQLFCITNSSYIKLFICGENETPKTTSRSFKSKVTKKNTNPSWNFEITSETDPVKDKIIIKVFLKNKFLKDECLGSINIHLSNLNLTTTELNSATFDLPRTGRTASTIQLSLACNQPSSSCVSCDVKPQFKYKLVQPRNGHESLPTGWLMSTTQDGKIFYLNQDLKVTTWRDPRIKSEEDIFGPLPENWEELVNEDGSLFYIDHVNKRTQWEDPRLKKFDGPEVLYSVEFKEKHESFIRSLGVVAGTLKLKVRREWIFRDSYRKLSTKDGVDLKQRLRVKFVTEDGLDAGGVSREWFFLLSKQMFSPQYGLFEYSSKSSYSLQINPSSCLATELHLTMFYFIGKICATAVYHRKLVDVKFTRVFYKTLLGEEIKLDDVKVDDLEYYNSLKWILDNDPQVLDLTFSVTENLNGLREERNLKPDGDKIKLTDRNKEEFVELVLKWRYIDRVKSQMDSFISGFSEVIPSSMLKIFSPDELNVLLSGLPHISVADWKANTKYKGLYHSHHPVVLRFWKVVHLLSEEQKSQLLRFVTGSPRAPMNGFAELGDLGHPFTIEDWGNCELLPLARTCFNRLYLPPYSTYEEMKSRICCAIGNSECFDGVD